MKRKNYFIASLVSFLVISCEQLVTTFNDTEDAILYQANLINEYPAKKSVRVMTWNIRFGIARLDFFGDACGDKAIFSKGEVMVGLEGIAKKINETDVDIVLMQEVDIQSKRTSYLDQVKWLLNNTGMNYGAYASKIKTQIIAA